MLASERSPNHGTTTLACLLAARNEPVSQLTNQLATSQRDPPIPADIRPYCTEQAVRTLCLRPPRALKRAAVPRLISARQSGEADRSKLYPGNPAKP